MNKCGIVKDLLPLYADDVCTPESKKFVAEHLAECKECCNELDSYSLDFTVSEINEKTAVKNFKKRTIKKVAIKVTSIALLICIGLFGVYNIYWYSGFKKPFENYDKTYKDLVLEQREKLVSPIEVVLGKDNPYNIDTSKYEFLKLRVVKSENYLSNQGLIEIVSNSSSQPKTVLYTDKESLKDVEICIEVSRNNYLRYKYFVMFSFVEDEYGNSIYFYIDEDMNLILNIDNNYPINFYHDLGDMTFEELQEKHNVIREKLYNVFYEDLRVMMIVLYEGFGIGNLNI